MKDHFIILLLINISNLEIKTHNYILYKIFIFLFLYLKILLKINICYYYIYTNFITSQIIIIKFNKEEKLLAECLLILANLNYRLCYMLYVNINVILRMKHVLRMYTKMNWIIEFKIIYDVKHIRTDIFEKMFYCKIYMK